MIFSQICWEFSSITHVTIVCWLYSKYTPDYYQLFPISHDTSCGPLSEDRVPLNSLVNQSSWANTLVIWHSYGNLAIYNNLHMMFKWKAPSTIAIWLWYIYIYTYDIWNMSHLQMITSSMLHNQTVFDLWGVYDSTPTGSDDRPIDEEMLQAPGIKGRFLGASNCIPHHRWWFLQGNI